MAMLAGSGGITCVATGGVFRLARPSILEKLNVDELGLEVGVVLEALLVVVMVVSLGLAAVALAAVELSGTIGEACCSKADGSSLMASS